MPSLYSYRAAVLRVIDADTLQLMVDLGFGVFTKQTIRLHGIDCPELGTPEGQAAKEWVEQWAAENRELFIETTKDKREKYGRMLAVVFGKAGVSLSHALVEHGHAKWYVESQLP